MIILPAIDIKDGRCVRLLQGRMEDETVYGDDPSAMAHRWQDEGAEWLHIVDLNGAFEGRGVNDDAVHRIVESVDMNTELGGGIRDLARIETLLGMGLSRVIIGTAAVEQPEMVREAVTRFGAERIVVGIDARDGIAKTRGWAADGGLSAVELGRSMRELGVIRTVYTDISRDGMLTGPNVEETARMARETGLKVIASGGVSKIDDIAALKRHEADGIEAVITGKAIYEGTLDVREAIAVADA